MKRLTNSRQRQKGISSVGWIAVAGIFGLLLITFFKVFPFYYENYRVKSAMEALRLDESVDSKSKREIWQSLNKRLYVNDVKSVTREDVTMERKDGKTTVTVSYEKEDDYIGNLYIGGRFVESIVIER
ncbi:MAG: DUF4845 domain-containing protein [Gammaproteobacteria bacterium]